MHAWFQLQPCPSGQVQGACPYRDCAREGGQPHAVKELPLDPAHEHAGLQDTVDLRRRIESAHESISGQASQLTSRLLNLDGGAQTPQAKKISSDFRVSP